MRNLLLDAVIILDLIVVVALSTGSMTADKGIFALFAVGASIMVVLLEWERMFP